MLILATPILGVSSSVGILALPFRPLYNNMGLLSFLLFLRESHFNCPRMPVILPVSYHKPCRSILNLFQFFLKLIRMGDRAPILQYWTHHTFISCFLHILGAGEKSSPQETKCSIGLSANIADMRIPFRIICNCYTKVFDFLHIFENCTF